MLALLDDVATLDHGRERIERRLFLLGHSSRGRGAAE
jgi:hypothetical protein